MPIADTWSNRFSRVVIDTLNALLPRLTNTPISMLAIDCHPWDGGLYLAILQRSEVDDDPAIDAPDEMTAWHLYDCGESMVEWEPASVLATEMQRDYDQADNNKAIADDYLRACADALSSAEVNTIVQEFDLDASFRIRVAHPDDGREFYNAPSMN